MMPIIMGNSGNEYEIRKIGGNDKIKKHLANLGFVPGEKVTLDQRCAGQKDHDLTRNRNSYPRTMCRRRCSSGTWAVRRRRIITNNEEEMLMRTLKDVTVGETVNVVKLRGTGAVKRRIMDMGITRGAQIYVRKVAPLGDPVEVNVRGYELTVRRADAEMVEIEG